MTEQRREIHGFDTGLTSEINFHCCFSKNQQRARPIPLHGIPYENSGQDAGEIRAIKSLADER